MNNSVESIGKMYGIITFIILAAFIATLAVMGRELLSDSGFGFWTGGWTPDTSQWMADPYSFSHVLHGIFFFWFLLLVRKQFPLGARFVIAAIIETGWEILENSPIIINRYRAATASLDYFGDSILNATCDVIFSMIGFWIAHKYGWKIGLLVVIVIELFMLYFIRDNLTLNILMLIYPVASIKEWQMAG